MFVKKLKLLVFDWDGTLADSVGQIIACKTLLAKKYELPLPSEATIRSVLGKKFEEALATCFPQASPTILRQLGKEFHNLMQQDRYQERLFPGVQDVLQLFKRQGIKLAIATSKDRKTLNKSILRNQLIDVFDITCCGKEYREKPHPAMLQYMMSQLSVDPNECIMIGDSVIDIQFAGNAGLNTVCVTFGAHSLAQLTVEKPIAFINNWMELPEVIESLCYSNHNYY